MLEVVELYYNYNKPHWLLYRVLHSSLASIGDRAIPLVSTTNGPSIIASFVTSRRRYKHILDPPLTMAEARNFNPPDHDTFSPTYSHISQVPISSSHTLVTFAGQIGHDSTTNSIPATLGEQCSLAFSNVDKCLAAVGATKSDIIHVRHYVVDLLRGGAGQDPERARRYVAWMGEHRPPSTLLGVAALANEKLVYEIEIMCVVKSAGV